MPAASRDDRIKALRDRVIEATSRIEARLGAEDDPDLYEILQCFHNLEVLYRKRRRALDADQCDEEPF